MANASNAGAVYGVTFFLIGLAAYGSAASTIGAAAQIVFATFPVVQVWRR